MEAKYYTPTIEEFHVGFEFERKSTLRKNCWVKKFFADGESAEQYCYDDEGRVKLLDREDIEKCLENKYILFTFDNDIVTLEINNQIKFIGKCKNKSELKKIVEFIEY